MEKKRNSRLALLLAALLASSAPASCGDSGAQTETTAPSDSMRSSRRT